MRSSHAMNFLMGIYILVFFTYLFGPLIIMSFTAFNSAEFPAITPWECFSFRWFNEGKIAYDGQHLAGLLTDWRLHDGLISSLIIGAGVVCLSVPIGMAAAIVLTQVKSQLRDVYYSISIMPVLFPGVIIGISTVVLWDRIAGLGGGGFISDIGRNGIFLTILAQTCFISTYCFLIFVARLQRFDQTQEEAALDLGATQTQVFFKILIPISTPIIVVTIIWQFTQIWNDFLFGATFSFGESAPIQVALNNMVLSSTAVKEYNVDMAAAIIAGIPTLVVYVLAGKYFIRGLTSGAVKG